MKKILTNRFWVLVSLFALLGLFAGCGSGGVEVDEQGNVEATELDDSRVPEVEQKSGLELPADARIFTVVNNPSSYMFSFYTTQALDELKTYWQGELLAKGYSLKRDWTSYSIQSYSSTTAVFSKSGGTVSISIEDQDGQRLVNVTQD